MEKNIHKKLELVREEKLYRLLPGKKKKDDLEASGVALLGDTDALVVFDNLNQIAQIDLSLQPHPDNRLLPAPSPGTGFEDISIDDQEGNVFCLIEAMKDVDGIFRGFVAEYDRNGQPVRCTPLATKFENQNKGFEGLSHVRLRGREYLFALCEGNMGTNARKGGGRIDTFTRNRDGGWKFSYQIFLPEHAEFEDYAAIDYRDGNIAVVSQASARLWVAKVDEKAHALVPGSESIYRFPKKSYGNVEGIAWLSGDTIVAVSDKKKAEQPARCEEKDQSIHIFRIPKG